MVPKGYLWILRIFSLLTLIILGFIVIYVDPEKEAWSKGVLYVVLFIFFTLLFNLMFLRLRMRHMQGVLATKNVSLSFRQGMLLSILAVSLLALQSFRMLVWWDGLLVAGGIFLIEFYFLSKEQ